MLVEMLVYRSPRVILTSFPGRAISAEYDILCRADPSGEAKDSMDTRLSGPSIT